MPFDWADPLALDDQLTDEERMIRDAAHGFAQGVLQPRVIAAFRDELVGHYMNKDAATVARAAGRAHSLIRAIEDLNRSAGRLRPIRPTKLGRAARLIADFHLGDPTATTDSMRPWKRRRALDQEIRTIAADGGMRRFMGSLRNLLSGADGPTPSA